MKLTKQGLKIIYGMPNLLLLLLLLLFGMELGANLGKLVQRFKTLFFHAGIYVQTGFLVMSHDSVRGFVRTFGRRSIGPSVRNHFFWRAETKMANNLCHVSGFVLLRETEILSQKFALFPPSGALLFTYEALFERNCEYERTLT